MQMKAGLYKSKIFKGFWGQGKDDFDRKFYVEGGLLHGS